MIFAHVIASIYQACLLTWFSNFISYSGTIWQNLNNNNQLLNKPILHKWKRRTTSIPKQKYRWFQVRPSKHVRCVRRSPLYLITFSRRHRHSPILRSRIACDRCCHAATVLDFLVLAQTWNFCSAKQSPKALTKQNSPLASDTHQY